MREQLEARRAELQQEYDRGAAMLQQMERDREALTQTLLRISGALQLAGELLAQPAQPEGVEDGDDC
jgi:uncharacterized membrane-anchored protein YhcB (DUF1043 family)